MTSPSRSTPPTFGWVIEPRPPFTNSLVGRLGLALVRRAPALIPLATRLKDFLMASPTFGWVIQPAPPSNNQQQTSADELLAANARFIQTIRGHFDTLWMEDHFQWNSAPTLEAWTSLTWHAATYPDFRLGTLVLGQSYRNPALLAKMASTLQWLAGPRLILGIGAGWKEDEYRAYNWPFPPAKQRIEELRESALIIKALFRDAPASFAGEHYRIVDAFNEPRPTPSPPLMIGGGGEKLTLRVVAELADWWNILLLTPEAFRAKLARLHAHCEAVGRDPAEITPTFFAFISLNRDPGKVRAPTPEMPILSGGPAQIADLLHAYTEAGARHFQCRFLDYPSTDGVELFVQEVLPHFKG